VRPGPVAACATALGLPLTQPRAVLSGAFPERVVALQADVAVVVAYGRILSRQLLDAPRLGCVNVHASLLPRWRGAAPIQAAVRAGDALTGVCTQRMEEGLDTGPVYCARTTPIGPHETAGALHDRLSLLSAEVAVETLDGLAGRSPTPQDPHGVTWAPKITKDDGRVDWHASSVDNDRRVRAMTPWPGGWTPLAEGALKLLEVRPVAGEGAPGTVLSTRPLVVACGEGALELVTVQAPGRRAVSGADFANGARWAPGEQLVWPS
jgi:methionyl-tRNA formyltransferase